MSTRLSTGSFAEVKNHILLIFPAHSYSSSLQIASASNAIFASLFHDNGRVGREGVYMRRNRSALHQADETINDEEAQNEERNDLADLLPISKITVYANDVYAAYFVGFEVETGEAFYHVLTSK